MKVERYSPEDFKKKYLSIEGRICKIILGSGGDKFRLLFIGFLTFIFLWHFAIPKDVNLLNPVITPKGNDSVFKLKMSIVYPIFVLICLFVGQVTIIFNRLSQPRTLLFLIISTVFLIATFLFDSGINNLSELFTIVTFHLSKMIVIYLGLLVSKEWPIFKRFWFLLGLTIGLFYILHVYSSLSPGIYNWSLTYSFRWIFVWTLIIVTQAIGKGDQESYSLLAVFNPINLIYPLPLSKEMLSIDTHNLDTRRRGLRDIVISILLASIAIRFNDYRLQVTAISPFFYRGVLRYVYLFLLSYIYINIAVGCLRWMGFPLKDAYDAPLIAASPVERWRRWNTYFYDWLYQFIFFPMYRWSNKSLYLAVMTTFLFTALLHLEQELYSLFTFQTSFFYSLSVKRTLTLFVLHGTVVYVNILLSKWWPKEESRTGWIGVLVTWLLMGVIHAF